MEIKTDPNGFKYYDSLPEGWKPAVEDDFVNKDGLFIIGKAYLVQSFYSNKFECYRSRSKDLVQKLEPWMEEKRVFVLK